MKSVYKCGLLGEKVDYSRSPEIFEHIFACENIEGVWRTVNCAKSELGACLDRLRQESFNGLSVTIPHKEAIIPFLDEIDAVAGSLGSVNSVLL
ncbi:MAG: shikimate dehydrogenase, partial [candidate division Zixibacteria bacterium]|nr:shikimate dehydrogenase [candidate division Zixibacteria bacterium]